MNVCKKRKNRWNLIGRCCCGWCAAMLFFLHWSLLFCFTLIRLDCLLGMQVYGLNFCSVIVSISLNLELEFFFLGSLFGVARVHACWNSDVAARLYTTDCKMRLTNPFVYFEFCGCLAGWLLLLLLLVQHHRCTTFIRRTDLVYRVSSSGISFFTFLLSSLAVLLIRKKCCVSFIHTFHVVSFHFGVDSLSFTLLIIIIISLFLHFSLSPAVFSSICMHWMPICLAFNASCRCAAAVAAVVVAAVGFITVFFYIFIKSILNSATILYTLLFNRKLDEA